MKEMLNFLGSEQSKEDKIRGLRVAIKQAEKYENENLVIRLEAELRAVEKGEEFNVNTFNKQDEQRKKLKPKHRILREMQEIEKVNDKDYWNWDGIDNIKSYEHTFRSILEKLNYSDFQDLVEQREYLSKRQLHVLDLFGGAYFLKDLSSVKTITGVRLRNIDDTLLNDLDTIPHEPKYTQRLKSIVQESKRNIIEGNLYKNETWKKIIEDSKQKQRPAFDLIICRPEGPFAASGKPNTKGISILDVEDDGVAREEIYIRLLEKALSMLAVYGLFLSQIPGIKTPPSLKEEFWKQYIPRKEKEGFKFYSDRENDSPDRVFAVERTNDI